MDQVEITIALPVQTLKKDMLIMGGKRLTRANPKCLQGELVPF